MAIDKVFREEIYNAAFNLELTHKVQEEPFDYGEKNYYWLNANPKFWRINDLKESQEKTYTTYNERNNKRRIYKYMKELKH